MKNQRDGHSFLIPANRRLTWDLLWFNRSVPQCAHDRVTDLSRLAEARSACPVRISWPALFLKAYGLVAQEYPELRQTWYRWPLAHIYQHPHSVGILTMQREHCGQPWLFWARISEPEKMTLPEIQQKIDHYKNTEPKKIFRREIQLASLPVVFRRVIWGWNICFARSKRAKRLGTFFLSTLSGMGAEIQVPPAIQTGCLTYGPLNHQGRMRITLAYDHRVMDGALVATILHQLETILLETVRSEVLHLAESNDNICDAA